MDLVWGYVNWKNLNSGRRQSFDSRAADASTEHSKDYPRLSLITRGLQISEYCGVAEHGVKFVWINVTSSTFQCPDSQKKGPYSVYWYVIPPQRNPQDEHSQRQSSPPETIPKRFHLLPSCYCSINITVTLPPASWSCSWKFQSGFFTNILSTYHLSNTLNTRDPDY